MGLVVSTPPATEPISTAEAKSQARIEVSDDDTLIGTMIEAARITVEEYIQKTLIDTTYAYTMDCFPSNDDVIYMPKPPLSSVSTGTTFLPIKRTPSFSNKPRCLL